MQQLAASVRMQGHNPQLALIGWLWELNSNNNTSNEGGMVAATPYAVAVSSKHKNEVVTSNMEKDQLVNPVDVMNQSQHPREKGAPDHHGLPCSSYPDDNDEDHLLSLFQRTI